jgi:aminomethyltransferase
MPARRTPLFPQHLGAGGRMVEFAGWEMPQQYSSVREEQEAVRTAAGLFDVSHMGRFAITGPAAGEFLQTVVTNDLSGLAPDRALYTLMCLPTGGIIDDLVVYRGPSEWMVVVNAANRDKDMGWLREHEMAGANVEDRSEDLCLLALQGPAAERLLPAEGFDLAALQYFGMARGSIAGVRATISRTGYTGEDGFELFIPANRAGEVWELLVERGARPCGLAARDVCRLEAGLRLYGMDMDEGSNPYEVGLGWTVKLNKGDFIGREALEGVKAAGPQRTLVGLGGVARTIPRHGAPVRWQDREVGAVTSGTYSFWLRKGIAMASVERPAAPVGSQVSVGAGDGEGSAEVVSLPMYRGSVKQAARA